jgi:hypothetical protein
LIGEIPPVLISDCSADRPSATKRNKNGEKDHVDEVLEWGKMLPIRLH